MNHKVILRRILFVFLMGYTIFFVSSCAVNPVTGKKELSFLSYNDEIRLGRQADREIVSTYGLYLDNDEIAQYVDGLGQKMAKISHRPFLKFRFRVLDTPMVNAFALPGGYVYVTRGLLAYVNSEAELAGVTGHEIGHIAGRHSAQQYTRAQLGQIGFGIGSIFFPPSLLFQNAAQLGVSLLFLRFSRDHERQADSLGVEYASRIGYDATYMANFFRTLERLREQKGQGSLGWFSTHPDPEHREAATLRMAKRWQKQLPPYRFMVDRERYLEKIDGIVFGKEPRQGFVENGYFFHPILDYQFPVPEGWQLMNTAQEVRMVNPNRTAGMQLSLTEAPSARNAAENFLIGADGKVTYANRTKLNGYTTEIREVKIRRGRETFTVLAYFIEKDGRVFTFQGFTRSSRYKRYLPIFRHSMRNFDRLRNVRAKYIRPVRIRVVKVTDASTLREFLVRHPNSQLSYQEMAILNGMKLAEQVEPGDRIKILAY